MSAIDATAGRWRQTKEILADALTITDTRGRATFLDEACAGDADLREHVDRLLAQQTDHFDTCADRVQATMQPGRRLGPYELVRELGSGGMGSVWLARRADEQFEKFVAIKLLKRGTDTDEVLRRFAAERRILARLEHPNIAQLLDAGVTEDHLPYFVLEYVEGVCLSNYLDEHGLPLRERLRLFLKICDAVQFAHQNLVVHRDLKPGNILVTPNGEPKLLDFGVAKLVGTGETGWLMTIPGQERFTPAYASPEQIRGEPATTISDVYSAGAVLYEILTGNAAHRFTAAEPTHTELLRVVTDQESQRPSSAAEDPAVSRQLRGDLDNIVLKALRKEPSRRYSSVSALAEDIHRYLADRPVTARRDSFGYVAGKFIRRNKVAATSAFLICLTFIVGAVATLREWRIAQAQRARAERRFDDVHSLASSFLTELDREAEKVAGTTTLRSLLVERTLTYLDKVAPDAGDNRALQNELATAYEKVGDIQGNTYHSNLGDISGSIASYEKAVAIRQAMVRASPDADALHNLAIAYEGYADVLWGAARLPETLANYERAQKTLHNLCTRSPADRAMRGDLARVYHKLGDLQGNIDYANLGDTAAGVVNQREALHLREALAQEDPTNQEYEDLLCESYLDTGKMERVTGDVPAAIQRYQHALVIQQKFAAAEPANLLFRRHIAIVQRHLSTALEDEGRNAEALHVLQEALNTAEAEAHADSANAQAQRTLGVYYIGVAHLLIETGAAGDALDYCHKGIRSFEEVLFRSANNTVVQRDLLVAYLRLGDVYIKQGDVAAAREAYNRAKPLADSLAHETQNYQAQNDLAGYHARLAAWEREHGSIAEAFAESGRALAIREQLSLRNFSNAVMRREVAETYSERGAEYERQRDLKQARDAYEKSLRLWQDIEQKHSLPGAYKDRSAQLTSRVTACDTELARNQQ